MFESLISVVAISGLAVMPYALLAGVARLFGIDSWGAISDDRLR